MKKEMNLTGKNVLVVGSGVSGVAAAELLKKKGLSQRGLRWCCLTATGSSIRRL